MDVDNRRTSFDAASLADSLMSYPSTVALDDGGIDDPTGRPVSSRNGLISDFPHPPTHNGAAHDDFASTHTLTPKPSLKTLRRNYTINELPLLQSTNPHGGSSQFNPVRKHDSFDSDSDFHDHDHGHDPPCLDEGNYDLIAPYSGEYHAPLHSLEQLADLMFSPTHMLTILSNPRYLASFREFLLDERPRSIPHLTYYLNACKALKALDYANALVRLSTDVPPPDLGIRLPEHREGQQLVGQTFNRALEGRVHAALLALTAEELPAFITSRCIGITSRVVEARVRGTLPDRFRGTSDALAEVFCLTDPSRPDNPIIFASEEFHRTTQYGMDYVLGRNCRFLQGPKTNPNSVRRIREALKAGRHHSELFLNYRRDGSPFMNLLQCAPLCDSHGQVRYFIGAQIDVSGLASEGAQMDSLLELQQRQQELDLEDDDDDDDVDDGATITSSSEAENGNGNRNTSNARKHARHSQDSKSEFRELCELFSPRELGTAAHFGGSLFQPSVQTQVQSARCSSSQRAFVRSEEEDREAREREKQRIAEVRTRLVGSLVGVYENYLLVRPYPSLRILFTSPSLQIPGILQSSFESRIGETSGNVREELLQAMMKGRSVTARIKWVTRNNAEGRKRWVHCTPLMAKNGEVGVWMVVIVDDEEDEEEVRWKGNWPVY